MSLTIRNDVSPKLRELQRRLADPQPVLAAGAKVVQDVDLQARCNAIFRRLPWPLKNTPASAIMKKFSVQQQEWMKRTGRVVVWPKLQSAMPGDIIELTARRVTVVIAPESRSAVDAATPQVLRAMQAKVDDLVRGCR